MKLDWKRVLIPYGWCASYHRICPDDKSEPCGSSGAYAKCSDFRKVGQQGAIEKIDEDGERRIYLEVAKGVAPGAWDKTGQRHHSPGSDLFNH